MLRFTKASMLVTDIGFLLYWTATLLALVPAQYAYKDYDNPVLSDWNYSFVLLDVLASATGLTALRLSRCGAASGARPLMLVSLALTSTAGLQAVAFWALRGDFSMAWWLPNLFLLLFPVPGIAYLVRQMAAEPGRPPA
ncbi:hypothetical protein KSE_70920 [Kitasatospora setae KM-6054]|uniref:YvaD family protein n=1 Tax=Kitasatospora setae (strain ATCC 33774 / DSM 43861 / JCM 3304 / KCC A-0304 / NBRC 14216 / KM-6054) TaxID=452652 RepID=E4NIQ0_KITSK|nr:hypothetical protein KSE_70920 [Kitasatospora setae KM-6054]